MDMANIAEHGADVLWRARRGEVSRYMLHFAKCEYMLHFAKGAEHEDFRCPMDITTSKKDPQGTNERDGRKF